MFRALFIIIVLVFVIGAIIPDEKKPATSVVKRANSAVAVDYPAVPSWRVQSVKSRIDDSTNVYLSVESKEAITKRFGGVGRAMLTIRCAENTTSAYFTFAEHFMADIQSYGSITYRVDDQEARSRSFRESTDNEALGLWNGGTSIPFVKSLFGGKSLLVRATPFNESPITVDFDISGIEEKITPLRTACHW